MTQFGFKTETTAGVTVTPDKFLPILDGESLDRTDPILESEGLWAGALVRRMEATNGGLIEVGGSTPFELSTIGATSLFKHMLGAVNTSGSNPYTHVFTPGSLAGLAATLQFGVNRDGTVVPKTVSGAKVESWAIGGEEGAHLTLGIDWIAQRLQVGTRTVTDGVTNTDTSLASANADFTVADIGKDVSGTGITSGTYITAVASDGSSATLSAATTATATGVTVAIGKALASASYPSGLAYYKMHHATLTIDSTDVPIKGFEITGDNALVRNYRGGSRFSSEIKVDGDTERTYGGTLNLEYLSDAQINRYYAQEPFDLEIVADHDDGNTVTIAGYGRYDASLTPMGSRGRVMTDAPFRFFADTTDASALTITVVNTDSSAA